MPPADVEMEDNERKDKEMDLGEFGGYE